jgi:hypothetical protein
LKADLLEEPQSSGDTGIAPVFTSQWLYRDENRQECLYHMEEQAGMRAVGMFCEAHIA